MTLAQRRLAALVAAGAMIAAAWGYQSGSHTMQQDLKVLNSCQEDEACWNCATMGNRICGNGSD